MTVSPPLKWHGGKQMLADWILEQMPEHVHFVEPYAGGLGVLLAKPMGASEVVNDMHGALSNFWRTLQDPTAFEHLVRRAQATPVSHAAWEDAEHVLTGWTPGDEPDPLAAWAFFVTVRQSRQGLRRSFCTLSRARTRRDMNEQASAWLSAIDGLSEAHERLKAVVVLNQPALDVIRQQDGTETWFYLDPPYHPDTRTAKQAYEHEMSHEDHIELLDTLANIRGKFTLSGYPCELYEQAADICGWRSVMKDVPNHASGAKVKAHRIETLWMNY